MATLYYNLQAPFAALIQPEFLPMKLAEMEALGWEELDILLISGDAYLDHPAQGPALLGRWLIAHGFKTGLISQPRWKDPQQGQADLTVMGRPRLMAAVSAGSMDSLLAHYTAFRKKRSRDALTPGGHPGARPNRATLVYTGLVRAAFPGLPVLIGGLEASLRRLSHYDFWQDRLRPSIVLESKADLLVYGPGERPLLEVARRLDSGEKDLSLIRGTVTPHPASWLPPAEVELLPGHDSIVAHPPQLMIATLAAERLLHQGGIRAFQVAANRGVLMEPPADRLTPAELDFIYQLPFTRRAHPAYDQPIPALELLATSLTTHRGCGGGCSFCSLALHQGRHISSRSADSIVTEARQLAQKKPVALSDVGGATANLWGAQCGRGEKQKCARSSCLWPRPCPRLKADQSAWVAMLDQVAAQPGIKQVRVASGVRYDLAMQDLRGLKHFLKHYVGGQLKVAPEHLDPEILRLMRKPGPEIFMKFLKVFDKFDNGNNSRNNKNEGGASRSFLIPYLISAFPGSDMRKMGDLADWLGRHHWRPRQVQAFIPTPGTVATAMYYAKVDQEGRPLKVATTDKDRLRQHALLAPQPDKNSKVFIKK